MNKQYLVTGGTGFIGSALVRRLVEAGNKVRVFDSNLRGSLGRLIDLSGQIEIVEGDIRDLKSVGKACQGIDSIFHLAYLNGTEYFYSYPELVLEIAVKGMINIIEAAKKEKVTELILASSSEVYQSPSQIPTPEEVALVVPDPMNPRYSYGGGKIICEIMALHWAAKFMNRIIIFRPHNVYGPDMGLEHVIPQISMRIHDLSSLEKEVSIQGTGEETRAFIHIKDFIDGLMILKEKGENQNIYHIGTDQEITIRELTKQIAKCFDLELECKTGDRQKGGTQRRCPDISKMKSLGFSPKISLSQGLQETVRWYQTNRVAKCSESFL